MLVVAIISISAYSQHASISEDTAFYMDHKFVKGDTLTLAYGSGPKKDFIFVSIGSGLSGFDPLPSDWSKSDIYIDKIYKMGKKVYLRGLSVDNKAVNLLGSGKIVIDLEGAIDNKELIID